MLLYKTQPRCFNTSSIINLNMKEKLMESLGTISHFKNKTLVYDDLIGLVTDASILDGLISTSDYRNILVLPSFEDKDYDRLRDRNYRPVKSAGDHLLPVIHKVNESQGNMYLASPKTDTNHFNAIYDYYDIDRIECNDYFHLDGDFKMKDYGIRFDAVVLLGNKSFKKGKFSVESIASKFQKYCQNNFVVIDVRGDESREVKGSRVDTYPNKLRMVECVNTPDRVYNPKTRVIAEKDYMRFKKHMLHYYRLALNLESIDDWYKVFKCTRTD